jgi:hypothetical protein
MNNKSTLLRAAQSTEQPSAWVPPLAHALTSTTDQPEVHMWRAMMTWCYNAGEAADPDAWNLLVHATQHMLAHSPWPHRTSVADARQVIGEAARRMIASGMVRA